MEHKKPGKILLPPYASNRTVAERGVTIMTPDVDTLIDDATNIIALELSKISGRQKKGLSLGIQDARVLQGYIKALVELSKESRERFNDKDLAKMTDEELMQLVQTLAKKRLGTP